MVYVKSWLVPVSALIGSLRNIWTADRLASQSGGRSRPPMNRTARSFPERAALECKCHRGTLGIVLIQSRKIWSVRRAGGRVSLRLLSSEGTNM